MKPTEAPDMLDRVLMPAGAMEWEVAVAIVAEDATAEAADHATALLAANPRLRLWNLVPGDAAGPASVAAPPAARLSRRPIDAAQPGAILAAIQAAGLVRQVDALIALDAALAADTSRLLGWWINAGLVLKPGGRIVMTLADPTTPAGFQRIMQHISRFWRFQGLPCASLGFQSQEIATYLLTAIGFEIERLEPFPAMDGRESRDICLVARLARPGQAETFRPPLLAEAAAAGPRRGYSAFWTRQAARILAGQDPLRPDSRAAHDRLLANADVDGWSHAIEIGGGDARYTAEALAANPALRILGFDVSPPLMEAAAARLAPAVAAGRLSYHAIDPAAPDSILRVVEAAGLGRRIDAVFSIDALIHVGLQYQIAYWLSAALVLKPGGWLIISVADATSPAGFTRLVTDLPAAHAERFLPGTRLEYLSPSLVRTLLEQCGFDVPYIWNWNPADGGDEGRDLYVMARLARPEQADALRHHLAPPPLAVQEELPPGPTARRARDTADAPNDEAARALGQAYWRQMQIRQNPDMPRDQLRELIRQEWPASRRDATKLGQMVLRQLTNMGYRVEKIGTDGGET